MELKVYKCIHINVYIYFLLVYGAAVENNEDCPTIPTKTVQYKDKCLWTLTGGNMTMAMAVCRGYSGSVVTFDTMTEAIEMQDRANIGLNESVFVGGIRNSMNGTMYYDWLSRPGTWSPALDSQLDTQLNESENGVQNICLLLLNATLAACDCSIEMALTFCEREISDDCYCNSNSRDEEFENRISDSIPSMDILTLIMDQVVNVLHDDGSIAGNYTTPNHTSMLDLSEIQSVPGPNGSVQMKNLSSIFSYVMSHVIDSSNKEHENKHNTNDTGEELLVVQRNNTTLKLTFADLLELVTNSSTGNAVENTNKTSNCTEISIVYPCNETHNEPDKKTETGSTNKNNVTDMNGHRNHSSSNWPSFLNGLFGRNHSFPNGLYQNGSVPIREVKFQVSGVGSGNERPKEYSNSSKPQAAGYVTNTASAFVQNVTDTLDTLHQKTSINSEDIKTDLFYGMLSVAEQMMNDLADPQDNLTVVTDAIEISSSVVNVPTNGSHLAIDRGRTGDQLKLSTAIFNNSSFIAYRVSTIIYKDLTPLVKVSNRHVSSDVISVSVQHVVGNTTKATSVYNEDAIIFTMKTFVEKSKTEQSRVCAFLDFIKKSWLTHGCQVMLKNFTHTTCKCNHLTNFAILVMYIETEDISLGNQQALFTLTTVGCSLSIACLAMTIITYIYLRMLRREKIMIHANLSLALLLGQLVFVSSSDAYKHSGVCKAIAIVLHFLFMSSFTWMMVEGVALYRCCTRGVFNQRDMRIKYFLLGWGPPALIVTVSVAVEFPDYGNGPQYSCWLSIHNGLIWAFLGPMIVIVMLNMVVMGLVVKVFLTLKTNTQKTEVARLRGSVRAMLTLLPLLGLTWITSLLVPYSVVFHYLFIIINTVQGMCIFFFHCICNDEIRRKFREKTRRWSGSRTGSDVDVSHQQRRKAGSFDAIKNSGPNASPISISGQRMAWT